MSCYVVDDDNLSFVANCIADLDYNNRCDLQELVKPFRNSEMYIDKRDLYVELKEMNYQAFNKRYGEPVPKFNELMQGYVDKHYNVFDIKTIKILVGVIECYLYQCSEGDIFKWYLFKCLKRLSQQLKELLLIVNVDCWADVHDLEKSDEEKPLF